MLPKSASVRWLGLGRGGVRYEDVSQFRHHRGQFFSDRVRPRAAAGSLGRLRRGITPGINAISSIIFVFSLIAIVNWYRLRMSI
jgi:hypothetical protein